MTDTAPSLYRISIQGIPVGLWARSRDWFHGLLREFEVIRSGTPEGSAPAALVEFIEQAEARFEQFGRSDEVIDAALADQVETVDHTLHLPPDAAEASLQLWDLIIRAEEFCRSGDMLTVVPPPDVRRFVRWYLQEIADQIHGSPPNPWEARPDSGD